MARMSKLKSKAEITLPPEGRIEHFLATFSEWTNEEIFDAMTNEPEFLSCIRDDSVRAEVAKRRGVDTPDFDKAARQLLQNHIRTVRNKWDKRMEEMDAVSEGSGAAAIRFDDISEESIERIQIDNGPIDHLFGDTFTPGTFGIVRGKTYLMAGDEGVGKTRTAIDMVGKITDPSRKDITKLMKDNKSKTALIYFQNEVHISSFKQWAGDKIKPGSSLIVSEQARLQKQLALIEEQKPLIVIVDSLHMILETDHISGVIRTINTFRYHAVQHGYALILIAHLNKSGDVAGSRKVSYAVDAVMKVMSAMFPGQFTMGFPKKNRYGRTGMSILCQHQETGVAILSSPLKGGSTSMGGGKPVTILGKNALPPPKIDPNAINKKPEPEANKPKLGKHGIPLENTALIAD